MTNSTESLSGPTPPLKFPLIHALYFPGGRFSKVKFVLSVLMLTVGGFSEMNRGNS